MEIEQKKKIVQTEHAYKQEKDRKLKEYFENSADLVKRNTAIMSALEDGYRQAEVARHLGLTASAVAKVRKKMR